MSSTNAAPRRSRSAIRRPTDQTASQQLTEFLSRKVDTLNSIRFRTAERLSFSQIVPIFQCSFLSYFCAVHACSQQAGRPVGRSVMEETLSRTGNNFQLARIHALLQCPSMPRNPKKKILCTMAKSRAEVSVKGASNRRDV